MMKVSVIIPTYNRGKQILNLLQALEVQSYKEFEVVIVNDGSTDDTAEYIEKHKASFSYELRLYNYPNGGRAVARNRGVENARGELLLFYDDDVRPNPESIRWHVDFHHQHDRAIIDGPALYDKEMLDQDFQRYRMEYEHSWYRPDLQVFQKEKAGLTGANKSMRKAVFEYIGGFSEQLNDSEDFELCFRAMHKYGIPVFQDYRTWVFHDDYKSFSEYLNRRMDCNNSSKQLIELYPEILEHYSAKFILKPKAWKKPLFQLFQNAFWRNFPETTFFRNFIPKKVRYKLYDIIITSNTLYTN